MDGVVIGAAAGLALVNDVFPCSVGFHSFTTARVQPGTVHVWLE
jgi:hypothetical protein